MCVYGIILNHLNHFILQDIGTKRNRRNIKFHSISYRCILKMGYGLIGIV